MPLPTIEIEEYDGVVGLAIRSDDMEETLFIPKEDAPAFAMALHTAWKLMVTT